jgi:pimeloyl-ACP methyl ester carboxylesterase
MHTHDDSLKRFEAHGAAALSPEIAPAYIDHDGARIWYATCGEGPSVILLHGGLGHSGNWGYQIPALVEAGYRVVLIDSRGHGRSTRDSRPYSYELMASDVLAVMDMLQLERVAFIGWSDGACIALIASMQAPGRVAGVFFFGCNMDPSGTKEFVSTPLIERCFSRHAKDYAQLSSTPNDFNAFVGAIGEMMRTQPNYGADELATIRVPVAVVQSEHDEFIKPEYAEYLARSIPGAELIILRGVSHFAPLQRPDEFNSVVLAFLAKVLP